jgi:predicted ATPase
MNLWALGYSDQASAQSNEAVAETRALEHLYSLGIALWQESALNRILGDVQSVHESAEALMELATREGFPAFLAQGLLSRGWLQIEEGSVEEGIAQLKQCLTLTEAVGAVYVRLTAMVVLATAHIRAEKPEEGLEVLEQALEQAERSGLLHWDAELHRLHGELLLQRGAAEAEAAVCFQKALDVARSQKHRAWELRTATSLSRLWQRQGRQEEARELLRGVYDWFTEGFDTRDLQEAKALLDEMG